MNKHIIMLNLKNKLKILLVTLIILSHNLFSINKIYKSVITRDIAINIGKFLPGDDQLLNQLVRLYPAEEITYKNIAQKFIERKLLVDNKESIYELLSKHFKTSRITNLQFNLGQDIKKLVLDNYLILISKQKSYLKSFFINPDKYFYYRKEILNANSDMLKNIKDLSDQINIQNLSREATEKLVYYKQICKQLNKNLNIMLSLDNQKRNYDITLILMFSAIKAIVYYYFLLHPITSLFFPNDSLFFMTAIFAYLMASNGANSHTKILKITTLTQILINVTSSLENDIERKIRSLDNLNS